MIKNKAEIKKRRLRRVLFKNDEYFLKVKDNRKLYKLDLKLKLKLKLILD
jgi:hypothetical protein